MTPHLTPAVTPHTAFTLSPRRMAWLLVLLPALGFAQEATPTPLREALPPEPLARELVLRHPAVRAARAQSEAQLRRADITENGNAEFNARISQHSRRVTDPSEHYVETSISVERPVRWWGKSGIDADIAGQGRAAARWSLGDAIHETSRTLLTLWLDHQRQGVRLAQAQRQAELARELERQAAGRLRHGDVAELDVSLARAELQRAEAQRSLAEAAHAATAARLLRGYPGIDPQFVAAVAAPEPSALAQAQTLLPAWPVLRQTYLEHHHGLNLARVEAANLQLKLSRAERDRYPDPTLGVYAANERAGNERVIGVSMSFPLPGQLRQNTALAIAAEVRSAEEQLLQTEASLGAELEARYQGLALLIRAAESMERAASTQERAAEKSARAYLLGEHSMTELVQNRRLATEQRSSALIARLDALETLALLLLDTHELWSFDD